MENKPRTIDEFFIEKYNKLEEENQRLARDNETLSKNCHFYEEAIKKFKKDFKVDLRELSDNSKYIRCDACVWNNTEEEAYEFFKNLFNLKTKEEEGENEDEQ